MSDRRPSPSVPARLIAGSLLAAPFVGLLWVGGYAHDEPRLFGIPCFYWYQLLWIPASAVLTGLAYLILSGRSQ